VRIHFFQAFPVGADPSGVGLLPLGCWYCGFESGRRHGCLSLAIVMCCQVEVSAPVWSLVHRSPADCGVCECDREVSIMRRFWPTGGCYDIEKKSFSDVGRQLIENAATYGKCFKFGASSLLTACKVMFKLNP
jgi:hypothetical protein